MSGDSDTTNLLDTHLETPLMSAATHDPFYVVKDELAGKLESIGKRLERFESLLWHTNTANNPDFRDAKKGLSREVKAAEAQLKDLELTVDYVERDRSAFAHIDDRELEDRQGFVASARQRVMAARETVSGAKTREKVDADEKEHLAQTRGNYGAQSDIEMQNTDYVHQSHAETSTTVSGRSWGPRRRHISMLCTGTRVCSGSLFVELTVVALPAGAPSCKSRTKASNNWTERSIAFIEWPRKSTGSSKPKAICSKTWRTRSTRRARR
mmetsp:Transcript_6851/g.21238  ORF Transcript_6851/g.21238 Transcript_6851/m.21238 type:complete len:268 (-) Transcript_6851:410-1213(-)